MEILVNVVQHIKLLLIKLQFKVSMCEKYNNNNCIVKEVVCNIYVLLLLLLLNAMYKRSFLLFFQNTAVTKMVLTV